MMSLNAFAAALLMASGPQATVHMLDVTSTYPDGYKGKISVQTQDTDGSVTGVRFEDSQGTTLNYTPDQLRQGVVLLHALNKDIIRMVSPEFDEKAGGAVHLVFLRNFLGSDFRKVNLDFVRDSTWKVLTDDAAGKEPFNGIHVVVKSSLGIPSSVGRVHLKQGDAVVRDLDPTQLPQARTLFDFDR